MCVCRVGVDNNRVHVTEASFEFLIFCLYLGLWASSITTTWFGFWFSRRFFFVALAVLELTLKTRLSLNTYLPVFCPPSARIEDVCHHCLAIMTIFKMMCGHYSTLDV